MLVGIFFLYFFAFFIKMCSPPRWEAHFRKTVFATIVCKKLFPHPNWLQYHHLCEGISALCCANYNMFCRVSGKWPTLEAPFGITSALACILKQIFILSVLTLPLFLGRFVDHHFYLRLHGMLCFSDRKLPRQA